MTYRCIKPLCDSMDCSDCNCAVPDTEHWDLSPTGELTQRPEHPATTRARELRASVVLPTPGFVHIIFAKTDVTETWRRFGWDANRRQA